MTEFIDHKKILETMHSLSRDERKCQAQWLRQLAEIDKRRLYALAGFPSLFAFVQRGLKYSEGSVGKRIQVMRTAEKFPVIYQMIEESSISLAVVSRLSPILTLENHGDVLSKACGMSTREAEEYIACLAPKPDVNDSIRSFAMETRPLEASTPSQSPKPVPSASITLLPAKPSKEKVAPLSEQRFHMNFTASKDTVEKQRRLKDVTRHIREISMEEIYRVGLELLLKKYDPIEKAQPRKKTTRKPAKHMRSVSRETRREVWQRDGGRCTFVSPDGRRCEATSRLQVDHRQAWGQGGSSRDPQNLRILCQSHNLWRAIQTYGAQKMEPYLKKNERASL